MTIDKNEKIGFHKGALDCLIKERAELSRILSIVDAIIQMHTKSLSDEGINIKEMIENTKDAQASQAGNTAQQHEEGFVNIDTAIADSKNNS
ncbi:MAG: hypothetical protein U9P44_00010 [archaeon]|nr:hypothetical protein [archaeon]